VPGSGELGHWVTVFRAVRRLHAIATVAGVNSNPTSSGECFFPATFSPVFVALVFLDGLSNRHGVLSANDNKEVRCWGQGP
jgi:hypothetical protein